MQLRRVGLTCLLIAGAALTGCSDDESALCDALGDKPEGLATIVWDNGVTESEATWLAALTAGVRDATADSRRDVAEALTDDDDGYRRLLGELEGEQLAAAELLGDLARDPDRGKAEADLPETVAAVSTLNQLAAAECGMA